MDWLIPFLCGMGAAVISAWGVGGGTLLLLVMTLFLGVDQRTAQGINLLFFLPTALSALICHWKNGCLDRPTLKNAVSAAVPAALLGAWIATAVDVELLGRPFGAYLLAYGALQPEPVLGVSVRQIPTQLTDTLWGLEVWADAGNAAVTPGGAADRAGIQTGDYILAVDGQETLSSGDVLKARWKHHVGDEMTLTIWRDGQILDVTLELTDALEK